MDFCIQKIPHLYPSQNSQYHNSQSPRGSVNSQQERSGGEKGPGRGIEGKELRKRVSDGERGEEY